MNRNKFSLSFLLSGLCVATCAQEFIREFHFVSNSLSWPDAQQFCREHYSDLATVSSLEEASRLRRPDSYSGNAWIGLMSIPANYMWLWSDGSSSNFMNWAIDRPTWRTGYALEEASHFWIDGMTAPFFCQRIVYTRRYSVVKVSFNSDLDFFNPSNSEKLLQELEAHMKNSAVKISWKRAPQKTTMKKKDEANCPETAAQV